MSRPPRKETAPFASTYAKVTCADCGKVISRHHSAPLGTLRDVWRCGPCDIAYCDGKRPPEVYAPCGCRWQDCKCYKRACQHIDHAPDCPEGSKA